MHCLVVNKLHFTHPDAFPGTFATCLSVFNTVFHMLMLPAFISAGIKDISGQNAEFTGKMDSMFVGPGHECNCHPANVSTISV